MQPNTNNTNNTNNVNTNLVFYSHQCKDSMALLQILKNENLLACFKLICVDGILDRIPPQITAVPTIIVAGINKPLITKEAFEWVNKVKFLRQEKTLDINRNIIKQNLTRFDNAGPERFVQNEMSGLSDKYAYLKTDEAQPHTYCTIGTESNNAIFTAPEQEKIKKHDQKRLLEEAIQSRAAQVNDFMKIMKDDQIKEIILKEQESINGSRI